MKTIYGHHLFKQFARYPSLYVLGAFPAWLKLLSRNFGAILLKKPKNIRDSVPLSWTKIEYQNNLNPIALFSTLNKR